MVAEPIITRDAAVAADAQDELAGLRGRFNLPQGVVYLDGNSLGAMPTHLPAVMADAVARQWGTDLIRSWNDNGWWTLPTRIGDRIGALVGAAPGQIVCGDSTSVQLYQALTALVGLNPGRTTLITDGGNFPTDQYIAESVARATGLRLIRTSPDCVQSVLDTDTAVVSFSAVDYRSGELWDATSITAAVHGSGALMLWDLCHVAGAVPFELDALRTDAAVGCSYKYLNGGPGAPAWLYLPTHNQHAALPLTGWHGHADPFALEPRYVPAPGIERARIGTPSVLAMLALDAALDVFDAADIPAIRTKSLALTDMVIRFADARLAAHEVVVATPRAPERRGSQVALRLPRAYEVTQALIARGVIGDFRAPDVLRLGFAAPYLGYAQVWDAMVALQDVLSSGEFTDPAFARSAAAPVT